MPSFSSTARSPFWTCSGCCCAYCSASSFNLSNSLTMHPRCRCQTRPGSQPAATHYPMQEAPHLRFRRPRSPRADRTPGAFGSPVCVGGCAGPQTGIRTSAWLGDDGDDGLLQRTVLRRGSGCLAPGLLELGPDVLKLLAAQASPY